jgi:hypothetical protein
VGGSLGFLVLACCVVCLGPVLGVSAIAALLYSNQVERSDGLSVRLEPNEANSLFLNDPYTTLRIVPGEDKREIRVDYTLQVSGLTQGAAQNQLDEIDIRLERSEQGVTVVIANAGAMLTIYDVEMTLTLPPQMQDINLIVDEDVYIEELEANFKIDASSGFANISLINTWGIYQLNTDSGNLTVMGEFFPEGSHRLESDSGRISVTIQEPADLKYRVNTGGTGRTSCPNTSLGSKNTSCQGTLGDGTGDLRVTSNTGDISLSVKP